MGLTVAKQKKRSGSGFLMGLVIGIAIGATVAWVLTPQPGEVEAIKVPANGAGGMGGANETYSADGGAPATIVDLAMAAVERVRGRFGEAVALGREAYEQGQAEVMQRFNQARSME
jgi:gas vesicle protein